MMHLALRAVMVYIRYRKDARPYNHYIPSPFRCELGMKYRMNKKVCSIAQWWL